MSVDKQTPAGQVIVIISRGRLLLPLLAEQTPASFIAFGLLALDDTDLTEEPLIKRREALERVLANAAPPIHITPATCDIETARRWFERFEGAGLDGLIAKPLNLTYQPDKRVMSKVKHERTADCVVAGYRVHKSGPDAIGSLLLGLYDDRGVLAPVGVVGASPWPPARARTSSSNGPSGSTLPTSSPAVDVHERSDGARRAQRPPRRRLGRGPGGRPAHYRWLSEQLTRRPL